MTASHMTAPPQEIVAAARLLSGWMRDRGYERWMLEGCADRGSVDRLQRELEARKLLSESDAEFLKGVRERLSVVLNDLNRRR